MTFIMADVIKLKNHFYATCNCGSVTFHLPVNGPGLTWTEITGSQCAECGQLIPWTAINESVNKQQDS